MRLLAIGDEMNDRKEPWFLDSFQPVCIGNLIEKNKIKSWKDLYSNRLEKTWILIGNKEI